VCVCFVHILVHNVVVFSHIDIDIPPQNHLHIFMLGCSIFAYLKFLFMDLGLPEFLFLIMITLSYLIEK
jgi:hypothetical protein